MTDFTGRIAGAPISWGVCEAPGWGYELSPDVVLADMARLGIAATELGPTGYLGSDPQAVRANLEAYGLRLVGGFLPVELHTSAAVDLEEATRAISTLAAGGAEVVVLAADAGPGGYERRLVMTDEQWSHLLANLDRVRTVATDHGLRASLHPHVGTAIESSDAVDRLLEHSDVPLCLDTGHLLVGGADPVALARAHAGRIDHVHLKDVRLDRARDVAEGSLGFQDGVKAGLFTPLGEGDIDIAAIVRALEEAGYSGWYVLEQDTSLIGPEEAGQAADDVRKSLEFMKGLA